jgi:hypothetical protein
MLQYGFKPVFVAIDPLLGKITYPNKIPVVKI